MRFYSWQRARFWANEFILKERKNENTKRFGFKLFEKVRKN